VKTIFVTERPTQIITAIALCENLELSEEVQILVADRFKDASTIVGRFSESESRFSFRLVASYDEAIEIAGSELPAHIFIHWDMGFGTQRRLRSLRRRNKGNRISVFEEGVGTYRQDIYPPIKKLIFRFLGFPVNIGGSRYISDIYVYDREKYLSNALVRPRDVNQIEPGLDGIVAARQAQFVSIFSAEELIESLEGSDRGVCTIYLSDFNFKDSDLKGLFPERGVRVLKLHPHCQARVLRNDILVAPTSLPAELLIMIASRIFNSVIVYHAGSSTAMYIHQDNVKFQDIRLLKKL
jgi:hypothetical protein